MAEEKSEVSVLDEVFLPNIASAGAAEAGVLPDGFEDTSVPANVTSSDVQAGSSTSLNGNNTSTDRNDEEDKDMDAKNIIANHTMLLDSNATVDGNGSERFQIETPENSTENSINLSTELPFYNDYNENYTDYPYYYYDDDYITNETSTETSNPFLKFDYNWYDYNELPNGTEIEEYTDEDRARNREKALAVFDNIATPPPIRGISFRSRDLLPYFLLGPPLACTLFIFVIFFPCVMFKWRDDIREMLGKTRLYGEHKNHKKQKRMASESYQAVDPEWQMVTDVSTRPKASSRSDAVQGPMKNNTYNKSERSSISTSNEYAAESSESTSSSGRAKMERPSSDVEGGKASGDITDIKSFNDDATTRSINRDSESPSGSGSGHSSIEIPLEVTSENNLREDLDNSNFSTSAKSYPKFSGWNKDLYSNAAGFGPPARNNKSSDNSSSGKPEDPSYGMY